MAVVAGVGPGNGAALARRFAQAGHAVALLARSRETLDTLESELGDARGYACDLTSPADVARTFAEIRTQLGDVDVLLYNAGSGVFAGVESITPEQFESAWRVNAYGALLCAQQVIPAMKAAGSGSIVFIGATASRRGGPRSAAFAPAKAAQRSLAESMARSLWPSGIHVALIVVDGVVDIPTTRKVMPDTPDSFFIKPSGVAEIAFQLTCQERSAWSFEVEARPFRESW
ncbi:SDR family NAD(P)-dependent oxidoreductase [Pyxidicoccus fallax]|uniref:SDR family NAD(P)-dependent oxidoreductase n=1 Tax=Pyxidicoccus fallax TaxID=394095 RepID=UPI001B7D49BD